MLYCRSSEIVARSRYGNQPFARGAFRLNVFNLELLRVAALDLGVHATSEELAGLVSQIAAKCDRQPALRAIDFATAYFAETIFMPPKVIKSWIVKWW
jgi:hypothetical protein